MEASPGRIRTAKATQNRILVKLRPPAVMTTLDRDSLGRPRVFAGCLVIPHEGSAARSRIALLIWVFRLVT